MLYNLWVPLKWEGSQILLKIVKIFNLYLNYIIRNYESYKL